MVTSSENGIFSFCFFHGYFVNHPLKTTLLGCMMVVKKKFLQIFVYQHPLWISETQKKFWISHQRKGASCSHPHAFFLKISSKILQNIFIHFITTITHSRSVVFNGWLTKYTWKKQKENIPFFWWRHQAVKVNTCVNI